MRLYNIEICRAMNNLAVYTHQRTHYIVTQTSEVYTLDVLPDDMHYISLVQWKEMLYEAYKEEVEKYLATPWNRDVYSIVLATNEYHTFSFYANNVHNYKQFREKYKSSSLETNAYYWKYHLGNFSYDTEAQSPLIFNMQRALNTVRDVISDCEEDEFEIAQYSGDFTDIEIVFDSLILDCSNYAIVQHIANELKDYVYEHVNGAPDFIFYASADGENIDRSFAIRKLVSDDVLHRIRPDLQATDEYFEQQQQQILQLPIVEQAHYWRTKESYQLTTKCRKTSYQVMEILLAQLKLHGTDVIELWQEAFLDFAKQQKDIFQASLLTYILYELKLNQMHRESLHRFLTDLHWERTDYEYIIKEIREILDAEPYPL